MSFYRQLFSKISPATPEFDQCSMYVRFLANNVALVEVVFRVLRVSFSVSLNQCFILSFCYTLLLPERKIDEVLGPSKNWRSVGTFQKLTKCWDLPKIGEVLGPSKNWRSVGTFQKLAKCWDLPKIEADAEIEQQFRVTHFHFLGAFAEFRKAIISFVISVRPSVLMEQLCVPTDGFSWNLVWTFFQNLSRKFKFH
jgi:hypothetical protein